MADSLCQCSLNVKTGFLEPSYVPLVKAPSSSARIVLRTLKTFRLVDVRYSPDGGIVSCSNLTLINVLLVMFGSMREDRLTMALMALQVVGSMLAFTIRYFGASLFYSR